MSEHSPPSADRAAAPLPAESDDQPTSSQLALDHPGLEVSGTVGAYRLVKVLGVGGMGKVYLAEQEEPVRRQVALKLVRGNLGVGAWERLAAERQVLARLSHPNVSALFEAGTTAEGLPYFVMERVEGEPITRYCDGRRMRLAERLRLFTQVCKAVQHAHQKGVIHCDLKPSNVMVAEVEGQAVPKVIDFGIARAIDQPGGELEFAGTPAYMSPEALAGGNEALDTRTDVYALGVVLYELAAGVRPHSFDEEPPDRLSRLLAEREPEAPLARFQALDAAAQAAVVTARGGDRSRLLRALGGDLGWIARRAVARDREQRYDSAAALAADLQRYLSREPVDAVPPSLLYVGRKFVRRHRAGVLLGGVAMAAVVAAIVATSLARVRAERARAEAEAVSTFLLDTVRAANPWLGRRETTVREWLDATTKRIETSLAEQPGVRAQLLQSIGTSQFHLGRLDEAERLLREGIRVREALDGGPGPASARIQIVLGLVRKHQGRLDEAAALLRDAVRRLERAHGRQHHAVTRALFDLSSVLSLQDRAAEAEATLRESLALRERLHAAGDPEVGLGTLAITWNGLASFLARAGRVAEAEQAARRALALHAGRGYAYARASANLGRILGLQQRWREAELRLREALDCVRPFLAADDIRLTAIEVDLALAIWELGRKPEAEALWRGALARLERDARDGVPLAALGITPLVHLGLAALERGDAADGVALLQRAMRAAEVADGPERDEFRSEDADLLVPLAEGRARTALGDVERGLRRPAESAAAPTPPGAARR